MMYCVLFKFAVPHLLFLYLILISPLPLSLPRSLASFSHFLPFPSRRPSLVLFLLSMILLHLISHFFFLSVALLLLFYLLILIYHLHPLTHFSPSRHACATSRLSPPFLITSLQPPSLYPSLPPLAPFFLPPSFPT